MPRRAAPLEREDRLPDRLRGRRADGGRGLGDARGLRLRTRACGAVPGGHRCAAEVRRGRVAGGDELRRPGGRVGMEDERKYLLATRPDGLEAHESGPLEQGYLALDPAGAEVRVRRKGAQHTLTAKT